MQTGLAVVIAMLVVATTWKWIAAPGRHTASADPSADLAHRNYLATTHFAGLDGLRAISVIAVVWCHVAGTHDLTLLNRGNKGVDLFFAISGFLVTSLLLREYGRTGTVSLRNFYIRRTLRIFPLYYAVLSLYCVLVFLAFRGTPKAMEFWNNFPAFASYTSNWFVSAEQGREHGVTFYFAWSLATEEQFYLFWPPLMLVILNATRRHWAAACAVLLLVGLQVLATWYGSGLVGTAVASLATTILFGAGFALLLHDRAWFRRLQPVLGHAAAAPVLALVLLLMLQDDATGVPLSLVIAAFVASLCIRPDTVLHPVLRLRPLEWIGIVSYGIYLMHMLAANVVRRLVGQHEGLLVFALTLLVVVAMAGLSYRFFELPILRLKKHFVSTPPATPPPRSAGSPSRI